MSEHRWFEDFKVGDTFESPSKTLNDAHFMFFAGLTGDAHPIHYDDEYAKGTRFGRRLAHGLLLTSMTAVGASTLSPLIEHSIVAFLEQTTHVPRAGVRRRHDQAAPRDRRSPAQAVGRA